MPKDREFQQRRQMVIRDMLREGEPKDQREIVEKLREMGIPTTQPSVSRDLKELGAVRYKGKYTMPSWAERMETSPFRRVLPLIRSIRTAGPYQMLMLTMDGAGPAVAAAIDASDWEDLVGTVSGYNSVLLLTEHQFFQDLLIDHLTYFKERFGVGEENAA